MRQLPISSHSHAAPDVEPSWREQLRAIMPNSLPATLAREITAAQYRRINALAPFLYIAIGSMAAAGAYGSGGTFSWIYHFLLPGFFIALGAWRSFLLRRRSGLIVSHQKMARRLRNSIWIALILAGVGSAWTLDAFYETVEARRVLAPTFVAFIAMAAAICLSPIPRAAIGVLVIALVPLSIAMIISSDVGIRSVGMSMIVLGLLMAGMVCHHFATLVGSIRLNRELSELAQTDPLTSLANRRGLQAAHSDHSAAHFPENPGKHECTLLAIDLNHFKAANDKFGHEAGDQVLIEIAARLRAMFPQALCIARLGGDEFAVLLQGENSMGDATGQQLLHAAIELPIFHEDQPVCVSAAIGCSTGAALETMLREADRGLYQHKNERSKLA